MRWNGNIIIFRHYGIGFAALWIVEVTPIEDDYANGMTSNKEYRVQIVLHSYTVKTQGESCTNVDGSNAP